MAPDQRSAALLDTLAVAYVAAGRFGCAVEVARSALQLAEAEGDLPLVHGIQMRLGGFRLGEPYRELGGCSLLTPLQGPSGASGVDGGP